MQGYIKVKFFLCFVNFQYH